MCEEGEPFWLDGGEVIDASHALLPREGVEEGGGVHLAAVASRREYLLPPSQWAADYK